MNIHLFNATKSCMLSFIFFVGCSDSDEQKESKNTVIDDQVILNSASSQSEKNKLIESDRNVKNNDIDLDFLNGKWKSRETEYLLELNFDYKVLEFKSNGHWRDLDGVKVLVIESEPAFIYHNDFFMLKRFNDNPNVLTIFRESPIDSDNYELIEFTR